jgi:hypothetical protein
VLYMQLTLSCRDGRGGNSNYSLLQQLRGARRYWTRVTPELCFRAQDICNRVQILRTCESATTELCAFPEHCALASRRTVIIRSIRIVEYTGRFDIVPWNWCNVVKPF